jgi:O-antigen/teichoic acid export membrane protein
VTINRKLFAITIFGGLLILLRLASGLIIAKAVAIYTGPSGMAMLGQVQSLFSVMNGIAAAPAGSGVVRYTAEYQATGLDSCSPWWKATLKWIVCILAIVIPISCIFARPLAHWAFGDVNYFWLIASMALALPLSVANTLIASVINGQHQHGRFIGLGMASVVVATIAMALLIMVANLDGAMVAAALFTGVSGLVMLLGSMQQPWFRLKYWWGKTDQAQMKDIGGYVAMALTSALTTPLALMMVRNILIKQVGWEETGQWQAVWKISEVYLGVISITLSTYFLPKLSTLRCTNTILKEIKATRRIIMPVVLFLAIIVYFLRDFAISLAFSEAFRPARDLFALQLLGDFIKIASLLYAYPMLSCGATKWFIGSEAAFAALFVLLTQFFASKYGTHGANIAYVINYSLYFIFGYSNLKHYSREHR